MSEESKATAERPARAAWVALNEAAGAFVAAEGEEPEKVAALLAGGLAALDGAELLSLLAEPPADLLARDWIALQRASEALRECLGEANRSATLAEFGQTERERGARELAQATEQLAASGAMEPASAALDAATDAARRAGDALALAGRHEMLAEQAWERAERAWSQAAAQARSAGWCFGPELQSAEELEQERERDQEQLQAAAVAELQRQS